MSEHTPEFVPRMVQDGKDRYRLLRPIGGGGMGRVYCAEDKHAKATVAIKFIEYTAPKGKSDSDVLALERDLLDRFVREMKMMKKIDHPNVASWLNVARETIDGSSHYFLVMEYVEGEDLATRLQWLRTVHGNAKIQGSLMSSSDIFDIGKQLGGALVAIHKAAVVHRDLKPQNIMLTEGPDGIFIKVIDFGVAKELTADIDKTSTVIGTPQYFSPEQAFGKEVDSRADLYALGAVLHECVTGQLTVDLNWNNSLELAYQLKQLDKPLPLEFYPSALVEDMNPLQEKVILDLLQRDVSKRIKTAEEFLQRWREAEAYEHRRLIPRRRTSFISICFGAAVVGVVITALVSKAGLLSSEPSAAQTTRPSAPSVLPAVPSHAPAVFPSTKPAPKTVAALDAKQRQEFLQARATVQVLPSGQRCSKLAELVFLGLMLGQPDFPDSWYWASRCKQRKGDAKRAQELLATYTEKSGGLTQPR